MVSSHQPLLALHLADVEIDALRGRVRALQAALTEAKALDTARREAVAAAAERAAAAQALASDEAHLESLTRAIGMLRKRLYDGSLHTAREAASVEDELRHRQAERERTEDAVLAAMERLDTANPSLADAMRRQAELEAAEPARLSGIKAQGRESMARVQALQAERARQAAAVGAVDLARYERLRTANPPAVAVLHAGICGGCGVALPTALTQKVVQGEILQCLGCGRIMAHE